MPAQQLLYRGEADLGTGTPIQVDIWISGTTAVAFEGPSQRGVLRSIAISLTEDRRLRIDGEDLDGTPTVWEGSEPERIISRWAGAKVAWPDTTWTAAEVTWTNYAVRVTAPGQTPRTLVGAKAEAIGAQRWIVAPDGSRISASAGRGCGCGGAR